MGEAKYYSAKNRDLLTVDKPSLDALITQSYDAIILGAYQADFDALMKTWYKVSRNDYFKNEEKSKICNKISTLFLQIITHAWEAGRLYKPLEFPTNTPPLLVWLFRFESLIETLGYDPKDLTGYPIGDYSYEKYSKQ